MTASAAKREHVMSLEEALFDYCLRLGDNALVQGQRLAEWISNGPTVELDIALGNQSLDLFGQARMLLDYAGRVEGQGRSEDDLAYPARCARFPQCAAGRTAYWRFRRDCDAAVPLWQFRLCALSAACLGQRTRNCPVSPRRRSRKWPTTPATMANGWCALATARRKATPACKRASIPCGPMCTSLFAPDAVDLHDGGCRSSASTLRCSRMSGWKM